MKAKTKQKIWAVLGTLVMLLPLFLGLGQANVNAADETEETPFPDKVNITLHKRVFENYPEEKVNTGLEDKENEYFGGKPLAGAEFTVYEVTDRFYELLALKNKVGNKVYTFEKAVQKMTEEENYLKGNKGKSFTTDKDGKAIFSDLKSVIKGHNAVYVFVETKLPDGVTQQSTPIVATLPFYSAYSDLDTATPKEGATINSDIHLYPKNVIPEREINLKKVGTDKDTALAGATFKIKRVNKDKTIEWFTGNDVNTGVAIFGKEEDATEFTTEEDVLKVGGLLDGKYTLVETKAPNGYQLSDQTEFVFTVVHGKLNPRMNGLFKANAPYGNPDGYKPVDHNIPENTLVVENLKVSDKYFVKKDANSKIPLDGAEFEIRKTATSEDYLVEITNGTGYKYAWHSEVKDNSDITWNKVTRTSENGGKFSFKDLKEGTYYLKETKAPDGYVLPDDATPFTVPGEKGTTEADPEPVENQPKGVLPSTGGKGIIAFVAIGVALVGGVGFYFMKRSKSTEA